MIFKGVVLPGLLTLTLNALALAQPVTFSACCQYKGWLTHPASLRSAPLHGGDFLWSKHPETQIPLLGGMPRRQVERGGFAALSSSVVAESFTSLPFERGVFISFTGTRRQGHSTPAETERLRHALKRRSPDPWLGFDKAQHVAFSMLWTLGSQYTLVNKVGLSERGALPYSIGSGAVLGLAKEVYDARWGRRRVFSYRDLAANAVGLVLAAGLIVL